MRLLSPLRDFLGTEAAGGVLLAVGAAIALVWANSPWKAAYNRLWSSDLGITVAGHTLQLDLRHWVNDGLMTIFFLVVGLEIKRELTSGHLSDRRAAMLPIVAAIGGMAVPALLFVAIADSGSRHGWGVPMATDIALAVGVVAVVGDRVPSSMRAFLLGLAIVDDIGAIVIIAAFYSDDIGWGWLALSAALLALTAVLRRIGLRPTMVYVVVGVALWLAMHEGGIHPTLAGVAMGLLAPTQPHLSADLIDIEELNDLSTVDHAYATSELARSSVSTVEWLEHVLHPWTGYVIVPVFALANAGIEISADGLRDAMGSALTWAVLVGLVAGKPLGVFVASRLAVRAGVADLPPGGTTRSLLGVGNAAGIGFTVALFVAELAFDDADQLTNAKLAILVASIVSAVLAFAVLRSSRPTADGPTSPTSSPRSSRTR